MFYIDKLKEKITEVQTGLTAALAYIESPEYRAQCEANYGKSVDMYPSMLGYLKAAADDARAREHDQALNALTDAGFDPDDDDDDILTCCSWRVQIETKRKNGDFWYEFTLESNGEETLRGKSGEFAALLAAVGISQQEVKS